MQNIIQLFHMLAQGVRESVLNAIPDTEGQLFDCSQIKYEITVLLPHQLLWEHARETVENIDQSTVH